jgi:hypothetical protein
VIILVLMTLHHRVIMITLARVKMPHVADVIQRSARLVYCTLL